MTGAVPERTARPPLYGDRERWGLVRADSLSFLALLPDASIDAIVTDPPYGLAFGGHGWDGRDLKLGARRERGRGTSTSEALEEFTMAWAQQARRVLRPGGYLVAFGAPRTVHRLVAGMERADLEIRDQLLWLFGSGMPKSPHLPGGLGTTLKPAYEPIVLARRPLDRGMRTVAGNVVAHGTGALNVDAATVYEQHFRGSRAEPVGRWPAHVTLGHDHGCTARHCDADCAVAELDRHAPEARPSRFFYSAKASHAEREAGLEALTPRSAPIFSSSGRGGRANIHPTVKPLDLMRWLVRLVTPIGGTVLDPFTGSGSTGAATLLERRQFVGVERDEDYIDVARARIAHWATHVYTDASPRE